MNNLDKSTCTLFIKNFYYYYTLIELLIYINIFTLYIHSLFVICNASVYSCLSIPIIFIYIVSICKEIIFNL